jgi:DNA primase
MSSEEVQQIKEKTDIVMLIGERINLKKAGRNFKGLCPFHGEKSPSFFVSPEMQMFKCFGCQASGDVITFMEQYEGWSFREALESLAKRVGVKLTPYHQTGDEDTRERLMELLHLAAEYYHYLLTEHAVGSKPLAYLASRGIHQQSIKDFMLGYSLESWDGLQRFLVNKKGYRVEELEAAGLVIRHDSSRSTLQASRQQPHYYDRFRGRIMFPLKDFAGHWVGFSGRVLKQEVDEAKYINSPETILYHKSECLFGLAQAKQAVRKTDRVVVVEGEMDVIMSHQAEVKEVVAVKGSALTEAQVLHLRKLTKNIVLSMDADKAGQEAMLRGIEVAEKQGMNLTVIRIHEGKDPADAVLKSPKLWWEASHQAIPVYQYLMEWAFEQHDPSTGAGLKAISQFLAPLWARIENAVERTYYIKKLAQRLQVGQQVVEDEITKVMRNVPFQNKVASPEQVAVALSRREKLERYIVAVALQADNPTRVWDAISTDWFTESYLMHLVEEVKKLLALNPALERKQLLLELPAELQHLAQELYGGDPTLWRMDAAGLEDTLTRGLKDLRLLSTREAMNRVMNQLSEEELEVGKREQLLAEYRRLSHSLKSLS